VILTTNEFAALHEVDYAVAAGTLKFLLAKGIVTEAGSRPNPTGKGQAQRPVQRAGNCNRHPQGRRKGCGVIRN
jgi:hypothetical protein